MRYTLRILSVICCLLFAAPSFAAFPIKPTIAVADSTTEAATILSVANAQNGQYKVLHTVSNEGERHHKRYRRSAESAGILSFVFGLLGLLFAPLGIPALILGIQGSDARNKNAGFAIAGIVLGALECLVLLLVIVVIIALV